MVSVSDLGVDAVAAAPDSAGAPQAVAAEPKVAPRELRLENERITIMMCAFEGPPKIFRFYGRGQVLQKGSDEFAEFIGAFGDALGARPIIRIDLERIIDSCGYSVPKYEFKEDRYTLKKWAETKGEEGVLEYQALKNAKSLDGL